jgi:phosphopantothenoylcysteine decarboxylase/phosphopantothenate--cysteine ligase
MGLEIAKACQSLEAQVSVILGPIEAALKKEFSSFSVNSYVGPADYGAHLEHLFPSADIFLSLAAVLDFEFVSVDQKIEREALSRMESLNVPIRRVPDYVAWAASHRRVDQRVIAFAAESGSPEAIVERASRKREKKRVDAIVANPVAPGLGPESESNEFWVIRPGKPVVHLGPSPKAELARPLLETLFRG